MENYPKLLIVTALISISGCDGLFINQNTIRTELPTKDVIINGQQHVVYRARLDHHEDRDPKNVISSRIVWSVHDNNGEVILCSFPTIESCANALQSGSMSGGGDY